MNRLTGRRSLMALAVLLGLNLAVYLAYTLPRSLQQRNLDARLALARDEVERERQRLAAVKAHYDLVTANTRDTAEFYSRKIGARGASLVPLLREIETLAKARGLRVGSQSFSYEPVKGAPVDRFVVRMPVRGTYRELVGFVEELERSSHFVTLDEIMVRGQQGSEGELQMSLSCYFRAGEGRAAS